nr:helix-turn-helix domain-containing protein [Streptomyces aureocirculatus]
MSHRDARLAPTRRLCLARCVVDGGWPLRRAAERFQLSHTTVVRWTSRSGLSHTVAVLSRRHTSSISPSPRWTVAQPGRQPGGVATVG